MSIGCRTGDRNTMYQIQDQSRNYSTNITSKHTTRRFTADRRLNASRSELRLECNREDCWGTIPRTMGYGRARTRPRDRDEEEGAKETIGEEGSGKFTSGMFGASAHYCPSNTPPRKPAAENSNDARVRTNPTPTRSETDRRFAADVAKRSEYSTGDDLSNFRWN